MLFSDISSLASITLCAQIHSTLISCTPIHPAIYHQCCLPRSALNFLFNIFNGFTIVQVRSQLASHAHTHVMHCI